MARRRKATEPAALQWPWQLTAVVAVVGFALFRWVPPLMLKGPIAMAFTPIFRVLGWFILLVFGLTSLVAFFRTRSAERMATPLTAERREPTMRETLAQEPAPLRSRLDDAWDEQLRAAALTRNAGSAAALPVDVWSTEVLRRMEWKRFEIVAAAYYRALGFRPETIRCGADGGIDIKLFRGDLPEAVSLVQCKAWTSRPVGVKPVRELLGVMTNEKVKTGVFLTTSTYTQEAVRFAEGNKLALINGEQFLGKLKALPDTTSAELLRIATEGDWTTPSCPSCGVKMVLREGNHKSFWGCPNYPRCRLKFFYLDAERDIA